MKNCDNCGNCVPHNPFIPICEQCVYVETAEGKTPSNWKPLPMTNADRIRAMTDEELAEYLVYHNPYSTEQNCLKWLQQPAEGDA
jgi:hypothetical protein